MKYRVYMGIDPSYTKTGWAIFHEYGSFGDLHLQDYGTHVIEDEYVKGDESTKYQQYKEMADAISLIAANEGVKQVIIESMFIGVISQPMIRSVEARSVIMAELSQRYPLEIVHAMTVKKHFFGKRAKVSKAEMKNEMRKRFQVESLNEHEADAMAVVATWFDEDVSKDVVIA